MTTMRLSDELVVPTDLATEGIAILGKRGSGKTNTAVDLVEEMIDAGIPVVVVDTVGVWWGMQSPSDAKGGRGREVVIFGGEHADVPLEEGAGKVIADAVVDYRLTSIIDTSSLSKAAARRFLTAFVEQLYHRKGRDRRPLHVVFDEADELAPQRSSADGARLLGAMEDFVRRGRSRGLGVTLVTQRPAVLNKDVLTQVEVLIAMRMTGPNDVKAIDAWTSQHADEAEAARVRQSLASLPTGTGWVWSPQFLELLQLVPFRMRSTFDSSATPKIGEQRVEPTERVPVDLAKLGDAITATVERSKATDPKRLQQDLQQQAKEIADLRIRLKDALAAAPEPERVEVPVVSPEAIALLDEKVRELRELTKPLEQFSMDLVDTVNGIQLEIARNAARVTLTPALAAKAGPRRDLPGDADGSRRREIGEDNWRAGRSPALPIVDGGVRLAKAERSILTILAQRGAQSDRQIATLAGYTAKGGGFRNALGSLRSAGYLTGTKDSLEATPEGITALGEYEPLPTGRALLDYWLGHQMLGKAERLILAALAEVYPRSLTQEEVAERTNYEPAGGGFRNAVGKLRSLQLIRGGREALSVNTEIGEAARA